MKILNKKIVFIDKNNHVARLDVSITNRNGYPEFTASGQFLNSRGQCLDKIVPANDDQKELLRLWKKYHLKNVSKVKNFFEHLEGVLFRIENNEKIKKETTEEKTGDDKILELMEQDGISSDLLDAVKAYIDLTGSDDLSDFEESYQGEYSSDEDFARETAEQLGEIPTKMQWPHYCIDWNYAARELMMDYSEQNGYYFRNI